MGKYDLRWLQQIIEGLALRATAQAELLARAAEPRRGCRGGRMRVEVAIMAISATSAAALSRP
jgi:hypothetical protein